MRFKQSALSIRCRFTIAACAVLLTATVSAWAEKFTIAVIPDTQCYSAIFVPQPRGEDTFVQQMQYLVDKREEKNLVFVTFVGDIVNMGEGRFAATKDTKAVTDSDPGWGYILDPHVARIGEGHYATKAQDGIYYWDTRAEWDIANRSISILGGSGIPFGMSPGNHDYDTYHDNLGLPLSLPGFPSFKPLRGGRTWDYYFGPASHYFSGKPWYGGSFNEGLNSYQFFTGGGKRFLHISFEMEPSQTVLDWAQKVIDANPGLPVVITTHEWLEPARDAKKERPNGYRVYFTGTDHLSPDEIWDRFVRKNPAIFLILCGHLYTEPVNGVSEGENLRIDKNDAGYPVYQVLQDYQAQTVGPDGKPYSANGGAGWLRFIEFDTDTHKMHFYTYSTLLGRYAGRDGYLSFGTAAHLSDFELDFPPQLLK